MNIFFMWTKPNLLILGLCFFFATPLLGNDLVDLSSKPYKQWFAGPFFTPLGVTPSPSHPAVESALGYKNTYGFYDSDWKLKKSKNTRSVYNYLDVQIGLNSFLGVEFLGSWTSNTREKMNSTRLQDTVFRLGFQLVDNQNKQTAFPSCRIILQEVFPTGSYQKLNPKKGRSDATGLGSFQTGIFLAMQGKYKLLTGHNFQTRLSIGYFLPSPVKVNGFNTYGGGFGTKGTVFPGSYLTCYLSGQYSLNNSWAIGFDSNYRQSVTGKFSGKKGSSKDGLPSEISVSPITELSLAPELSKTFSKNSGALLGLWFSLAGRNSSAFNSIFFAYLHIF